MRISHYRKWCSRWWRDLFMLPVTFFYFLKRLWEYREVLWDDFEGDWIPIARMLQYKIRRNRESMERNKIIVNWERPVKQQCMAEALLQRIIDDDYINIDNYKNLNPKDKSAAWDRYESMRNQDLALLCKTLEKHLLEWWD